MVANINTDNQAIVIGGSIAGLLSARVLADKFNHVIVIEADKLPTQPNPRIGVPQSVQPHILFAKGYKILEELFAGIGDDLYNSGGVPIDWAREFHYFGTKGWNKLAGFPSNIVSFTCSRPLLEYLIRERLRKISNVEFLEQNRVTGLIYESSHVTGVKASGITDKININLPASLVVDTSGRRSQAPKWLKDIGFNPPQETVVNPFVGYATRRYREPKDFADDWKVMLISQSPPDQTRLGYLARIEDGEWIATLGGYGHDYPPLNGQGFLEFARSLREPKFYEAIKEAEPISPIYAHRTTSSRLRHYEKIKMPEGFVCLGDAVCALCPVYGQGMTISALSATLLNKWLEEKSNSSNFQKSLAKNNSFHWALATGQDSKFPTTEGGRKSGNLLDKLMQAYTNRLFQLADCDPQIQIKFMEVAHLLKSPVSLFHPSLLLRVLGNGVYKYN